MGRLTILLFSLMAFRADAGNWLQMDPKVLIDIESYDKASQTYKIIDLKYPGQGPLIATPDELARCISTIKLDRIRREPTSIVKTEYQTEKQMNFLSPKEIAARKKKLSKH